MTRRERAAAVEARLRLALDPGGTLPPEGVDMSAAAVSRRLMDLAEMSGLCLELARAGVRHRRSAPPTMR